MTEFDISNSPRDALVNIIAKAISTGARIDSGKAVKTNSFYAGVIRGELSAAAILVGTMYSSSQDYADVRTILDKHVEDIHLGWSAADLRDAAKVGNEADAIATLVIDSL